MKSKGKLFNLLAVISIAAIFLTSCVGVQNTTTPAPTQAAPAPQSTSALSPAATSGVPVTGATPAATTPVMGATETAGATEVGTAEAAGTPVSSATTTSGAAATPNSAISSMGPVTLSVVQGETGQARLDTTKCIVAAYQKMYPNVTVNVDFKDLNSHLQTVKLLMTGDNPPDVAQGNQGWDIIPPLIKAGAIVNFDQYNSQYGWDKKFAPDVIRPNKYSTDGTKFGEGSLWGLSPFSEYVGIFYNKDLLQKLGVTDVSQISTLDAFEAILAKAKAQGMQPIILGDADKLTANHFYGELVNDFWDPGAYSNWIYGAAGSNIVNADTTAATNLFQDWYKKGYINQDINALKRNDAIARFGQGGGVFLPSGNWTVSDVYNGLKDKASIMLFPTGKTGKHVAIGSVNLPWMVSTKSKHVDLAVNFVDFATTSESAIDCMMQNGTIPAVGIPQGKTFQLPLGNDVAAAYNQLVQSGGALVPWMDWPTPRMLDVLGSGVQQMMVGQEPAQPFLTSLQTEWDSFYKNKK